MKTLLLIVLLTEVGFMQVTEEWLRIYEGNVSATPFDMTVDELGNVYIVGSTVSTILNAGSDYTTIKYSSSGVLQWEATYDGDINNHDWSYAVAVDPFGNVYVTGESKGVINGFDSGSDYLTIKYDSQGNELWTHRYHGNNSFTTYNLDVPNAITVDDEGNVYVTGTSVPDGATSGFGDCLTIKYSTTGNVLWTARYGNNSGGYGQDVKVDASGNVYVLGYVSGDITIKYNSSGQELWARRYDSTGTSFNLPKALVIDDDSNVYVTGGSEGYFGYLTLKYNSSGDLLWFANYSKFSTIDKASDITVDDAGNVYVTGSSGNSAATTTDYVTIKYNFDGVEQWVSRYTGLGGEQSTSGAEAIALDELGNVYVTGRSEAADFSVNGWDYATIKYSNAGIEQWVIRYDSGESDRAIGIFVDTEEKVYVTGESHVNGNQSFVTIKYSQSPSDVQEINSEVPKSYSLLQNYPNPFNPTTKIRWQSPVSSHQSLKISDVLGNEVAILVDEFLNAGNYEVDFNARGLTSGIYFYKLQAGTFIETKKMILIK